MTSLASSRAEAASLALKGQVGGGGRSWKRGGHQAEAAVSTEKETGRCPREEDGASRRTWAAIIQAVGSEVRRLCCE